jgi:E3 ubiquitin-protein ligase CHFR
MDDPRGFAPLIESELFVDVHPVPGGPAPDPASPRNRICRHCAGEVFLWGLRDWWAQERVKGRVAPHVLARKNCPGGKHCTLQINQAHARERQLALFQNYGFTLMNCDVSIQ